MSTQDQKEDEISKNFRSIDVDGRGFISKKQLRSHLSKKNNLGVSKKEINALFNAIDTDVSHG